MTVEWTQFIPNEQGMQALGRSLALACSGHKAVLFLQGQLGAGKTTLVRSFLRGLGYEGAVKSPTYTLVEPYDLKEVKIFHFDFYRLKNSEELEFIGIDDYLAQDAIFLIEWPEIGQGLLPTPDLSCHIEIKDEGRQVRIEANSERGKQVLKYIGNMA